MEVSGIQVIVPKGEDRIRRLSLSLPKNVLYFMGSMGSHMGSLGSQETPVRRFVFLMSGVKG